MTRLIHNNVIITPALPGYSFNKLFLMKKGLKLS